MAHFGGANTFMRLLGVFCLIFIQPRLLRHILRPIAFTDHGAGGLHRFWRHIDPIGPHVGDQASLIKALCGRHGLPGAHAEFAACLLLQGRGHEGGRGVAICGFGFHRRGGQIPAAHRLNRQFRLGFIRQIKLIETLAAQTGQPRVKLLAARGAQTGTDGPIFTRIECLNFHFAVNDEPQADRLHPPSRFRPRQATPEHGGELEAHKVIQGAAGQIGLNQFHIHLTRILHGFGDGGLGDGVEHHTGYGRVFFDRAALGERLLQMPADRFALAVRVGREDQLIVVFEGIGNGLDVFFAGRANLPKHLKFILGIHRAIFGRQITHVTVRGKNSEAWSKIFVYCLCLSRRFYNNNSHGCTLRVKKNSCVKKGVQEQFVNGGCTKKRI